MAAWIVKMLLKVMKPFIKMAILSAVLEALTGMVNGETEEGETGTEPADEPEE
ncbi:MAG: hypothetical protein IK104_03165 [Clostridia bacterium]|nr:hypothetical protein [Clostridia bacterium]